MIRRTDGHSSQQIDGRVGKIFRNELRTATSHYIQYVIQSDTGMTVVNASLGHRVNLPQNAECWLLAKAESVLVASPRRSKVNWVIWENQDDIVHHEIRSRSRFASVARTERSLRSAATIAQWPRLVIGVNAATNRNATFSNDLVYGRHTARNSRLY
jgi:hypothetical protein